MALAKVASVSDLNDGEGKVVEIEGKQIGLFKVGGEFFAIDNTCHHRGGPLGEGMLDDSVVTCPWHGWKYDIKSGKCINMSTVFVTTFRVVVEGNDVKVEV